MIDTSVHDSDGWWLKILAKKLADRQPRLQLLASYYEGNPPLPVGAENARAAYHAFQKKARTNYADLIISALLNSMTPTGFRSGSQGRPDATAQRVWDQNALDVEIVEVIESMFVMGDGYALMSPEVDDELGVPIITAEDPRQCTSIHDPVHQRKIRAGLKMFWDPELERAFAYLYRPGYLRVASRKAKGVSGAIRFNSSSWDWDDELSTDDMPARFMPLYRFRNKRSVGEYERHIDLMDRIMHMTLQRMVIATMQAFRQRAVIEKDPGGLPDEDEKGNPIDYDAVFAADPGALWRVPAAVELWESGQVDLTPILASVKDDVRDLAAVTMTPLNYLMPDAAGQSAEGASLVREGRSMKADDRIRRVTQGVLDFQRDAFRIMGEPVPDGLRMTWAPTQKYSLTERGDASSKATDMPWRTKMIEIWQFSPEQVDQMEAERAEDLIALQRASLTAAATAPAGGGRAADVASRDQGQG